MKPKPEDIWRDADVSRIEDGYRRGLSCREIGRTFNPVRSKDAIANKLRRLGLVRVGPVVRPF